MKWLLLFNTLLIVSCVSENTVLLDDRFSVNVEGGSGSGKYPVGATVVIVADSIKFIELPDSMKEEGWIDGYYGFSQWNCDDTTFHFNKTNTTISFAMPAHDVTIGARYVSLVDIEVNGKVLKRGRRGEYISIEVPARMGTDSVFVSWDGLSFNDQKISYNEAKFTIPSSSGKSWNVKAYYKSISKLDSVVLYNPWAGYNYNTAVNFATGNAYSNSVNVSTGDAHYDDSTCIDLKVYNNLDRGSYLKPFLKPINDSRYMRISKDELSSITPLLIRDKIEKSSDAIVDLTLPNTWYVGKLGGNRGYVLLTGEVFAQDTSISQGQLGKVILRYISFPEIYI